MSPTPKENRIVDASRTVVDLALEHRGHLAGVALSVGAMLFLSGCSQADIKRWTPEGLSEGMAPTKAFLTAWGLRIGLGVAYGAFTGARAFAYRRDAWEKRPQYSTIIDKMFTQIEEAKDTGKIGGKDIPQSQLEMQIKDWQNQVTMYQRLINPVFSAMYVAKEATEGFLAGSMSQVAVQEAMAPETDVVTSLLFITNAAMLNYIALKR